MAEFSKATMARYTRQKRIIDRYKEQTRNIFTNLERFKWSHGDYLNSFSRMHSENDYKKLPQWAKSYLTGVRDQLEFELNKLHVYAYCVDGVYLPIDSPQYRAIKPQTICGQYGDKGASVWRDDISKVWYGFGQVVNVKESH